MSVLRPTKGFTLIELLVVIAIIGILSAVVLASLGAARDKALDTKRVLEVKALKTALALYFTDTGAYPVTAGTGGVGLCPSSPSSPSAIVSGALVPAYISAISSQLCVTDVDKYVGKASVNSAGPGYAIRVYRKVPTADMDSTFNLCMTGVNMDPTWFLGVPPPCNF